jgi:ferredoxin-thioredoxin reductase catalytic subunit
MKKMILNPNIKVVEGIKKRLIVTGGHCPCLPQDSWCEDTICPCKDFREKNECHCSLYIESEENEKI